MSPRTKNFKTSSIIYFEGDKAENIYLLKEGKINLIYDDLTIGEKVVDQISAGEFFGVKSGLIHFPREETAKVVTDSVVYEFSAVEFEALVMKNTNIILKMLKVFSNQLRKVGKQVQSIVGNKIPTDQADEFFRIGDYYLKNKKYNQAITVFQRYMNYYPNGRLSSLAANRLKLAQNALQQYGDGGGPTLVLEEPADDKDKAKEKEKDNNKTSDDVHPVKVQNEAEQSSFQDIENLQGEADVFGGLDDNDQKFSKEYYKGISFMGQGKYADAFNIFKKIIGSEGVIEEEKIVASFEIGKCIYNLNKFADCISHYTKFLTKYPNYHEKLEILYFMGNSYVKEGHKEKAEKIFNNIISSSGEDESINRKAKKALKELG